MSDNLNEKQFPKKVYESDELHSPYTKKLKSKWIPHIVDQANKWNPLKRFSSLEWHLNNHHKKSYTTNGGESWNFESPPHGEMGPNEYHQHLHDTGHFGYGTEHEHFTPKNS